MYICIKKHIHVYIYTKSETFKIIKEYLEYIELQLHTKISFTTIQVLLEMISCGPCYGLGPCWPLPDVLYEPALCMADYM